MLGINGGLNIPSSGLCLLVARFPMLCQTGFAHGVSAALAHFERAF